MGATLFLVAWPLLFECHLRGTEVIVFPLNPQPLNPGQCLLAHSKCSINLFLCLFPLNTPAPLVSHRGSRLVPYMLLVSELRVSEEQQEGERSVGTQVCKSQSPTERFTWMDRVTLSRAHFSDAQTKARGDKVTFAGWHYQ